MRIEGVRSFECCPPEEEFLVLCVIICSFSSLFVLTMTFFGVSNSATDLRHSMSRKIQGVLEIVIGPVGQFRSVTNATLEGKTNSQKMS